MPNLISHFLISDPSLVALFSFCTKQIDGMLFYHATYYEISIIFSSSLVCKLFCVNNYISLCITNRIIQLITPLRLTSLARIIPLLNQIFTISLIFLLVLFLHVIYTGTTRIMKFMSIYIQDIRCPLTE